MPIDIKDSLQDALLQRPKSTGKLLPFPTTGNPHPVADNVLGFLEGLVGVGPENTGNTLGQIVSMGAPLALALSPSKRALIKTLIQNPSERVHAERFGITLGDLDEFMQGEKARTVLNDRAAAGLNPHSLDEIHAEQRMNPTDLMKKLGSDLEKKSEVMPSTADIKPPRQSESVVVAQDDVFPVAKYNWTMPGSQEGIKKLTVSGPDTYAELAGGRTVKLDPKSGEFFRNKVAMLSGMPRN